jgi:hypothetical protein
MIEAMCNEANSMGKEGTLADTLKQLPKSLDETNNITQPSTG